MLFRSNKEIVNATQNIILNRNILKNISLKNYVEKFLFEKMENSINGVSNYDNLTKMDIDNLIKAFEEMRKIMKNDYRNTVDIQLNDEEFKAIFDTAKEVKISVTAHAYGPRLMRKLIEFGITGMEHGSLMDEETAKLFEDSGTYLVPTFMPYEDIVHNDEESLAQKSPEYRNKLRFYQDRIRKRREKIGRAHV